jgi:hypothetical protein
MRAYKFLDKHFGLKSLYERRLKQSRIHEFNDPFELTPYDLTDPKLRWAFLDMREKLGRDNGLICFSASWGNPVIWAHYSDRHRGLCLGFEVPEITGDRDRDIAKRVRYTSRPLKFPAEFLSFSTARKFKYANRIPFTKFKDWSYEKEIRIWARLSNEEDGLHFLEFRKRMYLVEVIIGASCTVTRDAITRALGTLASEVKITRAACSLRRVQDG